MKPLLATTLLMLALALAGGQAAQAQTVDSGWLPRGEYQAWLDADVTGNLVPVFAEAGLVYGHMRYRVVFGQPPAGVDAYQLRTGRSDAAFADLNARYVVQGYTLAHHQRVAVEGQVVNQGIWYR